MISIILTQSWICLLCVYLEDHVLGIGAGGFFCERQIRSLISALMPRGITWLSRCKGTRKGGACVDTDTGTLVWGPLNHLTVIHLSQVRYVLREGHPQKSPLGTVL